MKTMLSAAVVLLTVFIAAPVQGGDDIQERKAYFEAAVDQEIAGCRQKVELRSSRSPNLRMQGHREASKALFLETHKVQLVENMVTLNMDLKPYKVHRFLNDRFSCTCYANWVPDDGI